MKTRTTSLGIELERQRNRQGLKVADLAKMVGRSRGYLSQIELGKKTATRRLLEQIAGVLEINPNVLLIHINLLRMDFTKLAAPEEKRDYLADLPPDELSQVIDYINYLRYRRETKELIHGRRERKSTRTVSKTSRRG